MRAAVAALASGSVAVQFGMGAAVDAGVVLGHFRRVAGGAELDSARGGLDYFMLVAVARDAGGVVFGITQHGVGAGAELGRHIIMAGDAGGRSGLSRVAFLRRPRMAIEAAEIFVNAV